MAKTLVERMVEGGIMRLKDQGYVSHVFFPGQPVHAFWVDNKGFSDPTFLAAAAKGLQSIRPGTPVRDQQVACYDAYKAIHAFQLPPTHPLGSAIPIGEFRGEHAHMVEEARIKRESNKRLETSEKIHEAYAKIAELTQTLSFVEHEYDFDDDDIRLKGVSPDEEVYRCISYEQNYANPKWLRVLKKAIKKLEAGEPMWEALTPVFVFMADPQNN